MKTIYYFSLLNTIGGIETFFYQLGLKYHDRDIIIYYKKADPIQLKRLSQYFECREYQGEKIICEQAIFNFNLDIIDNVEANEYVLVIHGDYADQKRRGQLLGIPKHEKITKVIAVSKLAAESYYEMTGIKAEVCYNPFTPAKNKKPLLLCSMTRLSIEKGFNRMKELALELERQHINYLWIIYTNSPQEYISDNVIYLKPRLDVENFIEKFDYLIQLSDNEGYCYSVVEALTHGVPVVVTPCPVYKEIKLNKNNSIYLDFDCRNAPRVVEKMIDTSFEFSYKPLKDNWDKILLKSHSDYYDGIRKRYKVKATDRYALRGDFDIELNFIPKEGYEWITSHQRAIMLESKGYVVIEGEVYEKSEHNNSCI